MKIKKVILGLILAISVAIGCLTLSGCNKQIFDLNYEFNRAYIKVGEEWKDVAIKSWRDYDDGEQIQIILMDGTVILTNSFNCILYKGTLPA